jgi:cytidylate kinase
MGRGANFMLPPKGTFRVRIIAHLDLRIQNVAGHFGVTAEKARRRVLRTESDRRAFVRKYFHGDIADPSNYDLVINTGTLSIEASVGAIKGALGQR